MSESKVRVEARPWGVAFLDETDRIDDRGVQSFTLADDEVAEAGDPAKNVSRTVRGKTRDTGSAHF